jgi:hypothetical protein
MELERLRRAACHAGEVFACVPDGEPAVEPPADYRVAVDMVRSSLSIEVRRSIVRRRSRWPAAG